MPFPILFVTYALHTFGEPMSNSLVKIKNLCKSIGLDFLNKRYVAACLRQIFYTMTAEGLCVFWLGVLCIVLVRYDHLKTPLKWIFS